MESQNFVHRYGQMNDNSPCIILHNIGNYVTPTFLRYLSCRYLTSENVLISSDNLAKVSGFCLTCKVIPGRSDDIRLSVRCTAPEALQNNVRLVWRAYISME